MEFYKLSNGDIIRSYYVSMAFQITTGIEHDRAPELYSEFLRGLSVSGRAVECHPTVQELVAAGNTVNACALYREQTGCTLNEAKKHIDTMKEKIA